VIRTLEALDDHDEMHRVAAKYTSRRRAEYGFPVPRAYSRLSSLLRVGLENVSS